MIGGCGFWAGLGKDRTGGKSKYWPWYSASSWVHSAFSDLDRFARLCPTVREVAPHEFGFLPQPARADAEQEATAAKPIETGNLLGQEERIAFGHQGNARAEFNGPGDPEALARAM